MAAAAEKEGMAVLTVGPVVGPTPMVIVAVVAAVMEIEMFNKIS